MVVKITLLQLILYYGTDKEITNTLIKWFLMVMWWTCFNNFGRKICAIDTDDYSCHGYYIINFPSYPYTLQADLCIDGRVMSPVEILCEQTYFVPVNINSHYYVLQRTKFLSTNFSFGQ